MSSDEKLLLQPETDRFGDRLPILYEDPSEEPDNQFEKEAHKVIVDNQGFGSLSRPIHLVHHGQQDRQQAPEDKQADLEDYIRRYVPFKGRWQTILNGNDLLIPGDYQKLLRGGGALTTSTGNHLMLFGKEHWERMKIQIGKQLGFDSRMINIMRHLYMYHMEFDNLNKDGSVTLSEELINYAQLNSGVDSSGKGYVVLVGLMYYAEVHNKAKYDDLQLSAADVKALTGAF